MHLKALVKSAIRTAAKLRGACGGKYRQGQVLTSTERIKSGKKQCMTLCFTRFTTKSAAVWLNLSGFFADFDVMSG